MKIRMKRLNQGLEHNRVRSCINLVLFVTIVHISFVFVLHVFIFDFRKINKITDECTSLALNNYVFFVCLFSAVIGIFCPPVLIDLTRRNFL